MSNFGFNTGYIEDLYAQYLENPSSVSASWRDFFADYQPDASFTPAPHGDGDSRPAKAASPTPAAAPTPAPQPAAPQPVAKPEPKEAKAPPSAGDGAPAAPARPTLTVPVQEGATVTPMRGVAGKIVENMEASLSIPTATSVRTFPVKLMSENRRLLNRYQQTVGGNKVSFTHLIAFAIVRGLAKYPGMNATFRENGTVGERIDPPGVNLGLAIDIERRGQRQLLVPNVKNAQHMRFAQFLGAYNDIVKRARNNTLEVADFQYSTATLTNPGMIGTVMSVPRLMPGQGVIIAAGSIGYPPEYSALPPGELSRLGISEVMTLTSTYDHRVIQGAESGEFLSHIAELLTGSHNFYEDVFRSLGIPTPPFKAATDSTPAFGDLPGDSDEVERIKKQAAVLQLIRAYRVRGHLLADTNPLGPELNFGYHPEIDPAQYGLTIWDLDRLFITGGLGGKDVLPLRDILDILWETYTRKVGSEFMHISSLQEKLWLMDRIESARWQDSVPQAQKRRIAEKLNQAEALESFIHTKYVGHKRFSLEGAETLIPILDQILSDAAEQEVRAVVMGMAHRGRLNVLTNIIGKPYRQVFGEFEGTIDPSTMHGSGDVKYHLGQEGVHVAPNGAKVNVTLAPNPSHLEAVNPVVEGMARAKLQRLAGQASSETKLDKVLPILMHGDAAFAGQGVVAETLNLSQLSGYKTGGTIHIVVNNQIGFTTLPMHARSSSYATDIARMIQAPIFHVNGDDPEAAVRVARLALDYRQVFNKDVVIDMVCYRKYGHNEGDEPSYTQPLMYSKIQTKRSVRKLYVEQLLRRGEMDPKAAEQILDDFRATLDKAFEETKELAEQRKDLKPERKARPSAFTEPIETKATPEHLQQVIKALVTWPEGFEVNKKLARVLERREQQYAEGQIDWAFGEALAFGTLLLEGTPVRLSGQDSQRGTFSHRHSVLHHQTSDALYVPLNHVAEGQAQLQVYDSLLSEYAVLGFEYGYSVEDANTLVLWEAQFGDFVNGAQIMIDQFIAAAEAKWGTQSSLVMLLPHGFEGQGPEHSSARPERFLQLCAEENLIVANFTTPANYFHALRRQVLMPKMLDGQRKPLIVMTPKSLLRHPLAVSKAEDFHSAGFQEVIPAETDPAQAEKLVLCTGKVYYDLLQARDKMENPARVAITRVEQLHPFPEAALKAELERFAHVRTVGWVQEEPKNMGAWFYMQPRLNDLLMAQYGDCNRQAAYYGRAAAASPAAGSGKVHAAEQEALVAAALAV